MVIEENYEDENEADDLNEPQRLSTVQENEPAIEVNSRNLLIPILTSCLIQIQSSIKFTSFLHMTLFDAF